MSEEALLKDKWAGRENDFFTAREDGNQLEERVENGLKIYKMVNWRTGYYYNSEDTKTQIVLHYTTSPVSSALPWLSTQDYKMSVAYMIARDGKVYELFDPKYWSNHLGITANAAAGIDAAHDDFCCKQSIGIEICNKGWLDKDGQILENDQRPEEYCRITDTEFYYKHHEEYREHYYYATYSKEQYDSLRKLLPYLCTKFNIEYKFLPPDKRMETLTADEQKNFKGILTHTSFRTGKQDVGPAFRWEEIMGFSLPISIDSLSIVKNKGIQVTKRNLIKFYFHTEKVKAGGYFPVGANTVWHGGVHLHKEGTGHPVLAMASGKIIAVRLGPEDKAKKDYGSNNFILLEHSFEGEKYYCLYMHLHWEELDKDNKNLQDVDWLLTQRTEGDEVVTEVDQEILDRLKNGEVCKIEDKSVSVGDKVWTSGCYGSSSYRSDMIHWGVFSEKLIMKNMWFDTLKDENNDSIADVKALIDIIDVPEAGGAKKDGKLSAAEINNFYKKNPKSKELRYYACKFILENAINWDDAVDKLQGRGYLDLAGVGLAGRLKNYNFWDEAKAAGVELPDSAQLWHYNPIAFIELAMLKTTLVRFGEGCFEENKDFPTQKICGLATSLVGLKRNWALTSFLCLGYAGSGESGDKEALSKKRAEAINMIIGNSSQHKLQWIQKFDYNSNWGNREVQIMLSYLHAEDGSGPYFYDHENDRARDIGDSNDAAQKAAVKKLEEEQGATIEGEGSGEPSLRALSEMFNRYYAAADLSGMSIRLPEENIVACADTHSGELPDSTFVDIIAFPSSIFPLSEKYEDNKEEIHKRWLKSVGKTVNPSANRLAVENIKVQHFADAVVPYTNIDIDLNYRIEMPHIREILSSDTASHRFYFDLKGAKLNLPATVSSPIAVNQGELKRIRLGQNDQRVRVVFDVTDSGGCESEIVMEGSDIKLRCKILDGLTELQTVENEELTEDEESFTLVKVLLNKEPSGEYFELSETGAGTDEHKYSYKLKNIKLADDVDLGSWTAGENEYSKDVDADGLLKKMTIKASEGAKTVDLILEVAAMVSVSVSEEEEDGTFYAHFKIIEAAAVELTNIRYHYHADKSPSYMRVVLDLSDSVDMEQIELKEEGKDSDDHLFYVELPSAEVEYDSPISEWGEQTEQFEGEESGLESIRYEEDGAAKSVKVILNAVKESSCKMQHIASGDGSKIVLDLYNNTEVDTEAELKITSITMPNDEDSFTTQAGENTIQVEAELTPSSQATAENLELIEWEIEDNPDSEGNSPLPNISSLRGNEVDVVINIANVAAGRDWNVLSYRLRAKLELNGQTFYSEWESFEQDEIDMLRQQYIDMSKDRVPARNEFINTGSTANFSLAEGACRCGNHDYQIWSVMDNLETVRTNLGHPMTLNSGYRCPIHNASTRVRGATNSQHIYGTAADISVRDFNGDGAKNQADWEILAQAARDADASYIEPYSMTGPWVHMDWR